MKPHEQRVVDERAELNAKLEKLMEFSMTIKFRLLDGVDQMLLSKQAESMESYLKILDARIARFPKS